MQLLSDQATCKMCTLTWNYFRIKSSSLLSSFFPSTLNKNWEKRLCMCEPRECYCTACCSELLSVSCSGTACWFWALTFTAYWICNELLRHYTCQSRWQNPLLWASVHIWTLLSVLPTLMQCDCLVHKIMA